MFLCWLCGQLKAAINMLVWQNTFSLCSVRDVMSGSFKDAWVVSWHMAWTVYGMRHELSNKLDTVQCCARAGPWVIRGQPRPLLHCLHHVISPLITPHSWISYRLWSSLEEQRIVPWPRGLRTILSKQWLLTGQQSVCGSEGDFKDTTGVRLDIRDNRS